MFAFEQTLFIAPTTQMFIEWRMALGQNIKALRTLLGTSRPELATAIGLDPQKGQQRIYALEERDSSKSDLAPALATHFGVSLRALIEDDLSGIDRDAYSQMVKDTQDGLHTLVEEVGDVLGNAVRKPFSRNNEARERADGRGIQRRADGGNGERVTTGS